MILKRFPWSVATSKSIAFKAYLPVQANGQADPQLPTYTVSPSNDELLADAVTEPDDFPRRRLANSQNKNDGPRNDALHSQLLVRGPLGLLRLLPREARPLIGRMLDLNPRRRPQVEELRRDPWVLESPVCSQDDYGEVVQAEGHVHNLTMGNHS